MGCSANSLLYGSIEFFSYLKECDNFLSDSDERTT